MKQVKNANKVCLVLRECLNNLSAKICKELHTMYHKKSGNVENLDARRARRMNAEPLSKLRLDFSNFCLKLNSHSLANGETRAEGTKHTIGRETKITKHDRMEVFDV